MKKIILALAAAALMPCVSALAENVDTQTGKLEDGKISWEYWNDNQNGNYYPNWKFVYNPKLQAEPVVAAVNYVLKKGDTEVNSGEANRTKNITDESTFYYDAGILEEGDYTMFTTFTFNATNVPENQIIRSFNTSFHVEKAPDPEYHFVFNQTTTATTKSLTINYEFTERDNKAFPQGATFKFTPGIQGFPDLTATDQKGSVTFEGLQSNTSYEIWANKPSVTIDGITYVADYANWFAKTEYDQNDYQFEFEQTTVPSSDKLTVNYKFIQKNGPEIPADATVEYIFKPGLTGSNVPNMDKEANKEVAEGSVVFDGLKPNSEYTLWYNTPEVVINGKEYKTDCPNNWTASTTDDPNVLSLTLKVNGEPTPTGATTGTLSYTIEANNEELAAGLKYEVWCVMKGATEGAADVEVGRLNPAPAKGTLELTGLPENKKTEIWVKARAYKDNAPTGDEMIYPGAAQGWTGLSITTVPSAVENIETGDDSTPARWFNLQGVEVENPVKGLYIKVQGKKATKVLL